MILLDGSARTINLRMTRAVSGRPKRHLSSAMSAIWAAYAGEQRRAALQIEDHHDRRLRAAPLIADSAPSC